MMVRASGLSRRPLAASLAVSAFSEASFASSRVAYNFVVPPLGWGESKPLCRATFGGRAQRCALAVCVVLTLGSAVPVAAIAGSMVAASPEDLVLDAVLAEGGETVFDGDRGGTL